MATFTSGAGHYTLILNAVEVNGSADVGSNTSKVSWSLQMRADSAYCQWNPGPGDFEVRINGGLVWSAQNPSLWYGGMGGTLTLASGTTTVGHNSDGSKTVYCEGKYIANSTANYLPNSSTCGGNLTLFTIPRASSFSSITGNTIGGSQTININRKSSSFTHNLWYRIGSGNWVSIATGVGTSKTWTLPKSLNNQIPNATSLTLTYLLRTYNGGTQIGGDVTYNFKVNYSGEKPTAGSVSITYTNLFNNKFIANYSTATVKYSGYAGVYGSTVKSAQVIFNGSWKGTTNYSTSKLTAGTHTFQGVVTDSRGNGSYASQQSFTCYQINNPTVSINAYRSDAEGNADPTGTYITIIPTYSAHDPVGGNSIKTNSFTCTSLMTAGTAIESGSKKILPNATLDSEYVISGTVTDQLGRSSATSIKVGTAFTIWDVRPDEKGMAFGKYSTGANKFEVAWDAYFDNDLEVGGKVRANSLYSKNGLVFNGNFGPCKAISGGGSSAAYIRLCRITINSSYINYPLEITYFQRGSSAATTLCIMFTSEDNTDPNLYTFRYKGECRAAYIVKAATSTWDIYITKSQSWDYIGFQHWAFPTDGINVTPIGENTISVPNGWIQAVNFYMEELRNRLYPVGAVYITYNNNNPGNFLGGTWVQFGQGRTLMGQGTGNDGSTSMSFTTAGDTGGKYKTSHSHTTSFGWDDNAFFAGRPDGAANNNYSRTSVVANGYVIQTASSPTSASRLNWTEEIAVNHIQPYVTIYFWRRTA